MTIFIFNQQKQIQTLNKLCSNLLEKLNNPREDRDAESAGVFFSWIFRFNTIPTPSIPWLFSFPLQHCGRTSPPSTLQTPTPWWALLPLVRGSPSAGLLVQWPQGTQARGPWWPEAQPCSRSLLAGPQASRELWEEPWPRSSRASQVGQQSSWVSIEPECSHYYFILFFLYIFFYIIPRKHLSSCFPSYIGTNVFAWSHYVCLNLFS